MRTSLLFVLACSGLSCAAVTPPPGIWLQGEAWLGAPLPTPRHATIHLHEGVLRVLDAPPAGAQVRRVDRITAAFVDAHAHPIGLGQQLDTLDLRELPSYGRVLASVAERASQDAADWLIGHGWDQNRWPDAPPNGWPLATDLDRVTGDRPALLRRVDGHAIWVNAAALRASGITAQTPDPAGGRIIRDALGAPTGVLIDAAARLVSTPAPSVDQVARWLRTAQDELLRVGLAGVHDMGVDDTTLAAYRALNAAQHLKIHVYAYLTPDSDAARALLLEGPHHEGRLHVVGVKAIADGALGSRGAHLLEPYADASDTRGLQITDTHTLTTLATRCLRVRAQLAVHAIGDAAARSALDAFEAARAAVPEARDVPLRLEHAQVISPQDLSRLAPLNVVASVQPTHATSDHAWAVTRLGPERVPDSYAWRRLLDAGARMVLGSDVPVESPDPALGLLAATQRIDGSGAPTGGWRPEQALREPEAIAGFSFWAGEVVGEVPGRCIGADGCGAEVTVWTTEGAEVLGLR